MGASTWRDFRTFGDPPMSPKVSAILLVLMYSHVSNWVLLCAALVLLAVNPAILATLLFFITGVVYQRRLNHYPKGYIPRKSRKMQPAVNNNTVADNNAPKSNQKITDCLVKCYKDLSIPSGKFDAVVLGSDLGGTCNVLI